ncbi:MAG: molybdate ABC transporter permease subunit [archaeon]
MTRFNKEALERANVNSATKYALIGLVIGFFLILVLFPIGSMFLYSAGGGFGAFIENITSPAALFSLKFSIILALTTTVCNVAIGTLVAFVLVRYTFFGKNVLNALVDLPIAIPTAVTGFTLLLLYGPMGMAGGFLARHGINIMFAFPGILLAHIFITFPFVVRAVGAVLEGVEASYEEAAKTLGASGLQVFRYVTLPSIMPGLVSGSILSFARSLGEFGATIMVSGNLAMNTQTAPLYIFSRFNSGDLEGASAVAMILAIVSFAMLYILKTLTEGGEK